MQLLDQVVSFPVGKKSIQVKFGVSARNGKTSVVAYDLDGNVFSVLSFEFPGKHLQEGEFFVKTWAENKFLAEATRQSGIFCDTRKRKVHHFHEEVEIWRVGD